MDKRGADKFLSIYWFLILFLVAGAMVYMAFLFYGSPYDVRNVEGQILGDRIADCLTSRGYLNDNIFSADFKDNFLAECHINFDTEDFSDWKGKMQYYIGAEVYSFDDSVPRLTGDELLNFSAGDINLKTSWELTTPENTIFSYKRNVNTIVIHATEGGTALGAAEAIADASLSIHYIIDRNGAIISAENANSLPSQYVSAFKPESEAAGHAGCIDTRNNNVLRPACSSSCVTDGLLADSCQALSNPPQEQFCCINTFNPKSIGIELVNLGDLCGTYPDNIHCQNAIDTDGKKWEIYSDAQINALANLVSDIASRYGIPLDREHIIGHYQITTYKTDPGPAFPWVEFMQKLNSQEGVTSAAFISREGQQERSFYALDKSGNQYIVRILALVGKIGKNEK
jgi:N-acetyl-anhydromuramyl-L-alanine amidase AmpD